MNRILSVFDGIKASFWGDRELPPWTPPEEISYLEAVLKVECDTKSGNYEEALQTALWVFKSSEGVPAMAGVRSSFLLGYWLELAKKYPRAKREYLKLRDKIEAMFLADTTNRSAFLELSAFNEMIGENKRTIRLFQKLARQDIEKVRHMYSRVQTLFIDEGMYSECNEYLDWRQELECLVFDLESSRKFIQDNPDKTEFMRFEKCYFKYDAATLVALLAINNRQEEAVEAMEECLNHEDDDHFRRIIDEALVGKFPDYPCIDTHLTSIDGD